MSNYETVLLSVENHVAKLTINKPKSLNALSSQVLEDIRAAVKDVRNNEEARVLVITGAGDRAFVAGADITEMAEMTALEAREFSILGNTVFSEIANLRIPTIAQVNGFALGGGLELAMSCDIRIGSSTAVVGLPESSLGVIPGFGGTQRLSRLIGISKAKELMYTARNVNSDEALALGIFNHVVEPEALDEYVVKMAERMLKNAPIAHKYIKAAVDQGADLTLERALAHEAELFGLLFSTEDQKAGMRAFVNKTKAEFKNR